MSVGLAIFVGGGLGSLARYGVNKLAIEFYSGSFPLGTFLANVLACIILGIAFYALRDKLMEIQWLSPMILIGFCGGFSTFSTFSIETFQLFQNGQAGVAIAYVLSSVTVCMGLIWWISHQVSR